MNYMLGDIECLDNSQNLSTLLVSSNYLSGNVPDIEEGTHLGTGRFTDPAVAALQRIGALVRETVVSVANAPGPVAGFVVGLFKYIDRPQFVRMFQFESSDPFALISSDSLPTVALVFSGNTE